MRWDHIYPQGRIIAYTTDTHTFTQNEEKTKMNPEGITQKKWKQRCYNAMKTYQRNRKRNSEIDTERERAGKIEPIHGSNNIINTPHRIIIKNPECFDIISSGNRIAHARYFFILKKTDRDDWYRPIFFLALILSLP